MSRSGLVLVVFVSHPVVAADSPTAASAQVVSQTATSPRPLAGNVAAVYPPDAKKDLSEAVVRFRADVNAAGAVKAFNVVDADINPLFVAAAEKAVTQWRFTPATVDGQPADGVFIGRLDFVVEGVLPSARMYPVSSQDVWQSLKTVLSDAQLKLDSVDESRHHLTTRWITVDARTQTTFGDLGFRRRCGRDASS